MACWTDMSTPVDGQRHGHIILPCACAIYCCLFVASTCYGLCVSGIDAVRTMRPAYATIVGRLFCGRDSKVSAVRLRWRFCSMIFTRQHLQGGRSPVICASLVPVAQTYTDYYSSIGEFLAEQVSNGRDPMEWFAHGPSTKSTRFAQGGEHQRHVRP